MTLRTTTLPFGPGLRAAPIAGLASACLWISGEDHARRQDHDGDGVPGVIDCDDTSPAIYPGHPENPCDGVDDDCEPTTPDGPAYIELNGAPITYSTVQEAIDASYEGTVVHVCPWRVAESVVVDVPGLTLAGLVGAERTTLDAGGTGPVVEVTAENVVLTSLDLTGGSGRLLAAEGIRPGGRFGGGLLALGVTITLGDVNATANDADYGGGFAVGAATIDGGAVTANSALVEGGGIYAAGPITMSATEIAGNSGGTGGGLFVAGASVTAVGVVVQENTADRGGGVAVVGGGALVGAAIQQNTATGLGGGAWLDDGVLQDAIVTGNHGDSGGGVSGSGELLGGEISGNDAAGDGGGLRVDADLHAVGITVEANTARRGGGAFVAGGQLAIDLGPEGSGLASAFEANTADQGGGGIAADGGSVDLAFVTFLENAATFGGALAFYDDSCPACGHAVDNTTFTQNAAVDGGGVWSRGVVTVSNSSFGANAVANGGSGGAILVEAGTTTVSRTSFDGDTATVGPVAAVTGGELDLVSCELDYEGNTGVVLLDPAYLVSDHTQWGDHAPDLRIDAVDCNVGAASANNEFTCDATELLTPCQPTAICL